MTQAPIDPTDTQPATEQFVDYWGTDERARHFLPDGKQFFEFKIMNEGERTQFQKLTNQDLTILADRSAKVKMDPGAERQTLIKTSVTGWNLRKDGEEILFSKQMMDKWLQTANPKLVDDLELAIRKANPWMINQDLDVAEIDKQIDELLELKKAKQKAEAGE